MSSTNQRMVDHINNNKGITFIYGCMKCMVDTSSNSITEKLSSLELKINELPSTIGQDFSVQLNAVKVDLQASLASNEKFKSEVSQKIDMIVAENNNIRKQFNRGDILVGGLPASLTTESLYTTAVSIAKTCGVSITLDDLNFCAWIKKKSAVLIKFNNIWKRDAVLNKYRETYSLTLNQISDSDIESRVYLSDHHTPLEAKLQYLCRIKKKQGEIKKFRIINRGMPIAMIVTTDGIEVKATLMDLEQNVFTGNRQAAGENNIQQNYNR